MIGVDTNVLVRFLVWSAKDWHFAPARLRGDPVAAYMTFPFEIVQKKKPRA